jgi:hypothetical protein
MRGISRLLRWPSGSVCVAVGGLCVSVLGYGVSRDSLKVSQESLDLSKATQDKNHENLLGICKRKGKLQFVSTRNNCTIDAIVVGWRALVMSNSDSPVNLQPAYLIVSGTWDRPEIPRMSYSNAKYGADHLLSDEGVSLGSRGSTTIGFDQQIPISPGAVVVKGVTHATTVARANKILWDAHFPTNLFGVTGSDPAGDAGFDDEEPIVSLNVKTSRGESFGGLCRL